MRGILIDWAVYSAALAVVAVFVPGFKVEGGFKGTLTVAAVFGLLNWALAWVLTGVLAVLTLGLSLIFLLEIVAHTVVTALVLKMTAAFTDKLKIKSFGVAFFSALLMSVTVAVIEKVL